MALTSIRNTGNMGCCSSNCSGSIQRNIREKMGGQLSVPERETSDLTDVTEPKDQSPPPKPCQKKREDILPDPIFIRAIEDHVLQIPEDVCSCVEDLAICLTDPFSSNLDKVKAIHFWITSRISYDVNGYISRDYGESSAEAVLKSKCTGYRGYCELFVALCQCIKVPVKIIEGYGKDDTNIEEVTYDIKSCQPNHAWNAVYVEDEWRLIDCTWDAGYIHESGHFQRCCQSFYFLTDPDFFIIKHFPHMNDNHEESQLWQLLEDPMDIETFSKNVILHEYALENGIGLVTHSQTIIQVENEVAIIVCGPDKPIRDICVELDDVYDVDETRLKNFSVTDRLGHDGLRIKVTPPNISTYFLKIYAKMDSEEEDFGKVATFIVRCLKVKTNLKPYPDHGIWGPEPYYQDLGFDKVIAYEYKYESATGEIDIYIPVYEKVEIVPSFAYSVYGEDPTSSVLIQTDPRSVLAIARMAKAGHYKLTISIKDDNQEIIPVVHYLITCKNGQCPFKPFPIAFPVVQDQLVTLIEPKYRDLPSRSYIRFRVMSPLLKSIRIGNVTHESYRGDKWDFFAQTPGPGEDFIMYAATEKVRTIIFVFKTVELRREIRTCDRLHRSMSSAINRSQIL